jgi:hypothetical protein
MVKPLGVESLTSARTAPHAKAAMAAVNTMLVRMADPRRQSAD